MSPNRHRRKRMGQKCIVCTAQVVNGPRIKFTSPQPGWWVSPVLTPCVTNNTMLKNRNNMWKAGEWSQSQLVPNSCLWLLLAVWPLTKNLTSISLGSLIWKMGRIIPVLKRHQRDYFFPILFVLPQLLSLLDQGYIPDPRGENSLADKKLLTFYREFQLRRIQQWVLEVTGPE